MKMKKLLFLLLPAFLFVLTSCDKQLDAPQNEFELKSAAPDMELKSGQIVLNFRTHLSGDNEVPPRVTDATGEAIFQLSKDGTVLSYKLIVANIENVTMAHIHLAPAGSNAGFVAWLYPSQAPALLIPGPSNGILAQGVITQANLVGALAGQPLSALINAMKAGNTYVNVHTSQYGAGEIRGQISGNIKE